MARPGEDHAKRALSPQVTLIAAAVIAIAILTWSGMRGSRLVAARRLDVRRAQATLDNFASLRARFEPAAAAESIAWRRTLLQLRELGVMGDARLAVTQRITRAAEAAGLTQVRVNIEESDTTGAQVRPPTEGVRSIVAPFSLQVECRGGLASVITFLGDLPPSVAPTAVSLVRQDGRGPHRISLTVYELTFPNGAPSGWSSVERGNAHGGDGNRPGG